ncbi:MAG: hypothetical protein KF696_09310 [Planctomycetes bacterium]|nr:hypothetical protein [Planctomycetota bacterium]MCW8136784.1 hypothetical protein [Planctomycetota bacterium]
MANALPRAKPGKPDDALLLALLAGDSGLGRCGLSALLELRRRQREIMAGSRGALVRLEPAAAAPFLELGQIGRDSPLVADYHSLLVLELCRHFPAHGHSLRGLLGARRSGLDLSTLSLSLWREFGQDQFFKAADEHGIDPHLLAATLWLALKPLYEGVALALARHFDLPQGGRDCPACGGPPWAMCEGRLRCAVCETAWQAVLPGPWREVEGPQARGARRLYHAESAQRMCELDESLFETAFDPGPFIELLALLEKPPVDTDPPIAIE